MSPPSPDEGSWVRTLLGALALVAAVVAVAAWSARSGSEVLPGGPWFATWAVAGLHAIAVVPLSLAVVHAARRRVPTRRVESVSMGAAVGLIVVALAMRSGGGLDPVQLLEGTGVVGRALARTVLTLAITLPGAWLLQVAGERWLGAALPAKDGEGDGTSSSSAPRAVTWAACVLGFALVVPWWGYPHTIQLTASAAAEQAGDGYPVAALRAAEQLRVVAGEAGARAAVAGLDLPRLVRRVRELEDAARAAGEDNAYQRAAALVDLGRHEEAEAVLGPLFERTGEPRVLRQLARSAYGRGDFGRAFRLFGEEAGLLGERDTSGLGELSGALQLRADALVLKARAARKLKRDVVAGQLLEQSLALYETPQAHLALAQVLAGVGRGRQAFDHLDAAVTLDPGRADQAESLRALLMGRAPDCAALSPVLFSREALPR